MRDTYLSDEELKAFIATLPTRRLAAGALIRNERGEMLLVKPNYKDGWILPGGTVEAGEAPKPGCEREIVEELGPVSYTHLKVNGRDQLLHCLSSLGGECLKCRIPRLCAEGVPGVCGRRFWGAR